MAKYTAEAGDTLAKLARRYGVKRRSLRELNPDLKFGKGKKAGGQGWRDLDGQELRLGKGVGMGKPGWKGVLMQDPKYAAFLRNFDVQRDLTQDRFLQLRDRQNRELERMEPVWSRQREDAFRNVDRSMDSRGVFRSGQRHIERGLRESAIAQARQGYIDQQGEAREAARRSKKEELMGLKRSKMEEKLGARTRLSERDAQTRYGF